MTQKEWEARVPDEIRSDSLWRVEAYRLGLFLGDLTWTDCGKLLKDRRTNRAHDSGRTPAQPENHRRMIRFSSFNPQVFKVQLCLLSILKPPAISTNGLRTSRASRRKSLSLASG